MKIALFPVLDNGFNKRWLSRARLFFGQVILGLTMLSAPVEADLSVFVCGSDYNARSNRYESMTNGRSRSNAGAFAALKPDGSIYSWGDTARGGTGAPTGTGYMQIVGTGEAFAALNADGSVFAWGSAANGGSGAPAGNDFVAIYSTASAFSALRTNGAIASWGSAGNGGSSPGGSGHVELFSAKQTMHALNASGRITSWGHTQVGGVGEPTGNGYVKVVAAGWSASALHSSGTISSWGDYPQYGAGGVSGSDYVDITATNTAYAAQTSTGAVVTWGEAANGGSGGPSGTGWSYVTSNNTAFAALNDDGRVYAWGTAAAGGTGEPTDTGYVALFANSSSFAALKADGSITAWGGSTTGGTGAPTGDEFTTVVSAGYSFAALNSAGQIESWGNGSLGGSGAPGDSGYVSIVSNERAFAAFKADGSIVTWGDGGNGGVGGPSDSGYLSINGSGPAADSACGDFLVFNQSPTITGVPATTVAEDASYSFTPSAADADPGDTLSFSILNKPAWASFDTNTGSLSGTPDNGDVGLYSAITISVSDGTASTGLAPFDLTVSNVNKAPVLSIPMADQAGFAGISYSFTLNASMFSDEDVGDTLSYQLISGPAWLQLSGSTLNGNPSLLDLGVSSFVLRAVDSGALFAETTVGLTVAKQNIAAPVFTANPSQSFDEGVTGTLFSATATDTDPFDQLIYSILGGADSAHFTVDSATGVVSFDIVPDHESPLDANADNNYELVLDVEDEVGHTASETFSITVQDINDTSPVFSSAASISANEGDGTGGFVVVAQDPDLGDSLQYSIVAGDDAAALTVDAGSGALSFVAATDFENPADSDLDNNYLVSIQVEDAVGNTASQALTISVLNTIDEAPVIDVEPDIGVETGATGEIHRFQAADTDNGDALEWSIVGGADAALFSLGASNGRLSLLQSVDFATPLDANLDNSYELDIRVEDLANLSDQIAVSVVVVPAGAGLYIVPDQVFHIHEYAANATAVATVNAIYNSGFAVTWSIVEGALPFDISGPGEISLDGALDYASVSQYSLTIRADNGYVVDEQSVLVEVLEANAVEKLVENQDWDAGTLSAAGATGVLPANQAYYSAALAAAVPAPDSISSLQLLIGSANRVAAAMEASTSGTLNHAHLFDAGAINAEPDRLAAYELSIASLVPAPETAESLFTAVQQVNNVFLAVQLADTLEADASTAEFANLLAAIDALGAVTPDLLRPFASLISRAAPSPQTPADVQALLILLTVRINVHPVVSLSLYQDGVRVSKILATGGPVTVESTVENPVTGMSLSYGWSGTSQALLNNSSEANPVGGSFVFSPSGLPAGAAFVAAVSVERNQLLSISSAPIIVADAALSSTEVQDSDGDGIADLYEGELDASGLDEVSHLLQGYKGNDSTYLLQAKVGVVLHLGPVAQLLNKHQANVTLGEVAESMTGGDIAVASVGLENEGSTEQRQLIDFSVSHLSYASASTPVVISLKKPLPSNAQYLVYRPVKGWVEFVIDGQNAVRSAPALFGVDGECPPPGHNSYSSGLTEGDNCIELQIEDGGPNDADRYDATGELRIDKGLNGSVLQTGAVIQVATAALRTENRSVGGGGGALLYFLFVLLGFYLAGLLTNCRKASFAT